MTYPQQPGGPYGPGDPAQQSGYPGQQPGYPGQPQQGYPQQQPQAPQGYPQQQGYPQNQQDYSPPGYPQPGYGQQQPGFGAKPAMPAQVSLAMFGLFGLGGLAVLQLILTFIGSSRNISSAGEIPWIGVLVTLVMAGLCGGAGFLVMTQPNDLARAGGFIAAGAAAWSGLSSIASYFDIVIHLGGGVLGWTGWVSLLLSLAAIGAAAFVGMQLLQSAAKEHFGGESPAAGQTPHSAGNWSANDAGQGSHGSGNWSPY